MDSMKLYAIALLPLLALAAWQVDLSPSEESTCDGAAASSCCAPAAEVAETCATEECFAPAECAGETVTCPPGPDCFAPDVCPDEETTCAASCPAE